MKKTHPMAQTRRFGSRNASKYCYVNLIPNQEESDRLSALKKEAEEGKEGEMVENAKRALAASDRASGKSSREQSQELELDTIDYAPAHSSKRMRVSSYATSDSSISLGTDPAEAAGGASLSVPAGQTSGFSPTTAAQVRSPVQWYRERLHDSPQSSPGGTSYSTFQHRSRTSSLSSSQSSMFGDSSKGDAASAYSSGAPVDSAPHQSYADIGLEAYSSLLGRNLPHNLLNQLYQRHHSSQNMNQFLDWPSKEISELDVQASQVWKEVEVFMQELVHRGEVGQVEEVSDQTREHSFRRRRSFGADLSPLRFFANSPGMQLRCFLLGRGFSFELQHDLHQSSLDRSHNQGNQSRLSSYRHQSPSSTTQ